MATIARTYKPQCPFGGWRPDDPEDSMAPNAVLTEAGWCDYEEWHRHNHPRVGATLVIHWRSIQHVLFY